MSDAFFLQFVAIYVGGVACRGVTLRGRLIRPAMTCARSSNAWGNKCDLRVRKIVHAQPKMTVF